jgi:hypothetical protein
MVFVIARVIAAALLGQGHRLGLRCDFPSRTVRSRHLLNPRMV